jgi:predicted TIM-barrel fold metal-dependent hydrolase
MKASLIEIAQTIPLTDNHCHGVIRDNLERPDFEIIATESDWPEPNGMTIFDAPVGIMMRAECAGLLDLPRHCTPDEFFNRRYELGQEEVTRRLVPATGIETFIVDSGFKSTNVLLPSEMQNAVPGSRAYEIVRLETVAESMAANTTAATFIADYASALAKASEHAIGFKSVMAYRYGLDFDPDRPSATEVEKAAGEWLKSNSERGKIRMDHPVLLRHILWEAVDYKLAIQFHVGYGDSDIIMHRCDPTQMTEFIRMTVDSGISIMLLHCYPFVQEAGYLAQVYPHVYLDTGASAHWTGLSSSAIVAQSVEMAPMSKVLFSSDAFGLPELYYVGTFVWRKAMGEILDKWVASDGLGYDDAVKYLNWMANDNARRAYRLLPK